MAVVVHVLRTSLALAALYAVLAGIGLLARRLFGLKVAEARDVLVAPWVGWAAVIAFLQLWHLRFPVNGCALATVCTLGALGLVLSARELGAMRRGSRGRGLAALGFLIVGALWLANQTTTQTRHYDAGFYYLTAIRWAGTFPIVPGLANLSPMLGFNNSHFLYAALLDVGSFASRSHHLTNGTLFMMLLMPALSGLSSLFSAKERCAAWEVFDTLLLVPAIVFAMGDWGSSVAADAWAFGYSAMVVSELLRLLHQVRLDTVSGRELGYRTVTLAAASAVAMTVKLSFAALGAASVLTALAVVGARTSQSRDHWVRTACWVAGTGLLLLAPWVIRTAILSGYALYPSHILPFPVEWRVSERFVDWHIEQVVGWARLPGNEWRDSIGNWSWVWPWINRVLRQTFFVVVPLAVAGVAAPAIALSTGRQRGQEAGNGGIWLFLAAPLSGLLFWFISAPDPRFAAGAFWTLGAGALAAVLGCRQRAVSLPAVAVFTAVLLAQNVNPMQFFRQWNKDIGPAPRGKTVDAVSSSGLIVHVPAKGDQCWDAPLPCTPRLFDPDLRLRVAGDLSSGFVGDLSRVIRLPGVLE